MMIIYNINKEEAMKFKEKATLQLNTKKITKHIIQEIQIIIYNEKINIKIIKFFINKLTFIILLK